MIQKITTTSDARVAFKDTDWILLVGAAPRKAGMERNDLLRVNGGIFVGQGKAIEEQAGDRFRRTTRPALFDILKVKLPPSLFDYTLEVLKDAIMKYQDPYGHVSQLDKVEFDRCECIEKNPPKKNAGKIVRPAAVW